MKISRIEHPFLYNLNVLRHRWFWWFREILSFKKFAREKTEIDLPFKIFTHKSVLIRKLGNSDVRLQLQKIKNLSLAAPTIHQVLIKPGETFSYWDLIGEPSARRGYVEGMLLSQGEVIAGVGGGLCQLANLLYWMAIHTPLTITERHRHSFDAFPDSGRTLPFASGATVFYNYVDLQFRNDTAAAFEIKVWLDEEFLHGEILTDRELPTRYHIVERDHRFFIDEKTGKTMRENKLFRQIVDVRTGKMIKEELVCENVAEVKYPVSFSN
ncbi:MAG: VanW family protein [Candidatus Uhrbacteria bacterium]